MSSVAADVLKPQRLSDWLVAQPYSATAYPLGLSWRVPEEQASQNAVRLELLKSLSGLDPDVMADPRALSRLREWLSTLPVTGRVPVSVTDARWLQANPARDPVLLPGHSVVLPRRPSTVTVVTEKGALCKVTHVAGNEARAYLEACDSASTARADWAWVAQPDGRIQRFGIAAWNREAQDEPAPGAWIWGPSRNGGWPERFSDRLITFLATQGPAPDSTEVSSVTRGGTEPSSRQQGGASKGFRYSDSIGNDRKEVSPHPNPFPAGGARGDSSNPLPASPVRKDVGLSGKRVGQQGINVVDVVTLPQGAPAERSRGLEVTSSDWGSVGLLQTPTARMRPAGHLDVHFSRAYPYTYGNVFVQPLDWLEAGFRYINISNRLYGPPELSGGQSAKDKSFDVKFRLWQESAYVPQLAVGLRDIGGTGLFAGEYLVGNKRTGDLDWSLGLGWGYVGGRGNLRNPLSVFGSSFDTRKVNVGQGGNFDVGSYFHGPAALFGGVQWQTPWERLAVKLEYDGNDYQHEPQSNNQKQSSPWNLGLVYRVGRSTDFTLGVERGNTLTLGLSLHTQLDGLSTPKVSDPPRVPIAGTRPEKAPDWSRTAGEIARQTDWHVRSIGQHGNELRVTIDDADAVYWRNRVDRAVAVLHRDAPKSIDRFAFRYRERGLDVAEHMVDRNTWLADNVIPLPPSQKRETVIARAAERTASDTTVYTNPPSRFETGFRIHYGQTLGGPDAFVLYQIFAEEQAKLRIRDDTWLQGSLRLRLIDNYDKFKFTGPSNLPRVRTFQREYLTTSRVTMPNLQLTHVGRLGENQYYSVYGGYLEEMFAGVGAEWLYRPFASRLAFGIDANEVRQRDFHQDFGFRDYQTSTGHATLYWDTGWNDVLATVSAGRYLAGDLGATLRMTRVFKNGVTVGAFATRTNVSAAKFGEGSFDKGVFLSIPFDAMFTRSNNTVAYLVWRPLTRDGGAKLARAVTLYNVTKVRDDRTLKREPAPQPDSVLIPADRHGAWQPVSSGPEPYTRITPRPTTAQWEPGSTPEYRLTEALYRQNFRNIHVDYNGSRQMTVTLSNDTIRPISRAVGRAARTALRLAPIDAREIRINYADRTDPVVRYEFFDLTQLERYFEGSIKKSELAKYVTVEYLNPAVRESDPLARLDDLDPEAKPEIFARLVPETLSLGRVRDDIAGAAHIAKEANWLRAGALGAGLVLASSALDKRAARFAKDHADSRWLIDGTRVGNAIPWIGLAGSALAALDGSDPRRSRTGYAAGEAGGAAILAATGLKYLVGRARPNAELGNAHFNPFSTQDSFPSIHTVVAWSVATPFALEYDAPWLYGVAAATNLARIGGHLHWVSDTVASSLIGYGLGRIFWESSRSRGKESPLVLLSPTGIQVGWQLY